MQADDVRLRRRINYTATLARKPRHWRAAGDVLRYSLRSVKYDLCRRARLGSRAGDLAEHRGHFVGAVGGAGDVVFDSPVAAFCCSTAAETARWIR